MDHDNITNMQTDSDSEWARLEDWDSDSTDSPDAPAVEPKTIIKKSTQEYDLATPIGVYSYVCLMTNLKVGDEIKLSQYYNGKPIIVDMSISDLRFNPMQRVDICSDKKFLRLDKLDADQWLDPFADDVANISKLVNSAIGATCFGAIVTDYVRDQVAEISFGMMDESGKPIKLVNWPVIKFPFVGFPRIPIPPGKFWMSVNSPWPINELSISGKSYTLSIPLPEEWGGLFISCYGITYENKEISTYDSSDLPNYMHAEIDVGERSHYAFDEPDAWSTIEIEFIRDTAWEGRAMGAAYIVILYVNGKEISQLRESRDKVALYVGGYIGRLGTWINSKLGLWRPAEEFMRQLRKIIDEQHHCR